MTVLADEDSGSFGAVLVMKPPEDRDGDNIGRWNRLLEWSVATRSLLAEHWEVINPNPDGFIVENGNLLIVSSSQGKLTEENIENFFRLTKPLLKGDWVMTVKMDVDFPTQQERPFIGLYSDKDVYLVVLCTLG